MAKTTTITTDRLTLQQAMVLRGFPRQLDLINASGAKQSAVSAMLRGGLSYPKAREQVARALKATTKQLETWIVNGALAATGQQRT